jgi:PKD repeat protein
MLFTSSGNYTITHCAANDLGSDCEVKTDYIWVYNSTVMITTPWRAEDMVFGGLVANATIDLLDIENDSWVNVTSSTGKSSITTLADHKLSGYGFAVGFNDAEQLIVEPQAFPGYVLYMYPTGFTNVSEGNVTVFVKAEDVDTGLAVIGATVTGQAAGGGSQVKTTNSAGWAQFVFPNNTNVHFKGEKTGYTGSTTIVLNTGVPSGGDTFVSGTVYLTKGSITILPTPTVTPLPGGGTPTPVQTYLPHCDPAASDYSAEECRAEQSSFSLSWLADNMLLLIQICFVFTILYIVGWKP